MRKLITHKLQQITEKEEQQQQDAGAQIAAGELHSK